MVDGESAVLKPHRILRIAPDTIHSIQTEGEALVLIISMLPKDIGFRQNRLDSRLAKNARRN